MSLINWRRYFDMAVGFDEGSEKWVLGFFYLLLILFECRQDDTSILEKAGLSLSLWVLTNIYSGFAFHHGVEWFKIVSSHELFNFYGVLLTVKPRINGLSHSCLIYRVSLYSKIAGRRIRCPSLLVTIHPIPYWSIHWSSVKSWSL